MPQSRSSGIAQERRSRSTATGSDPGGKPAGVIFLARNRWSWNPPLPPSQFNPDPGGGNLLEPDEPPDLFPPILPQPPEYGDEPVPRSLGLPRRGVREMAPERRKLDYADYPDSESGAGLAARLGAGAESLVHRLRPMATLRRSVDGDALSTGRLRFWHPYLQSTLKGDAPIIGQDIFLNLTLNDFFQFEARKLPTPSGVSAARPNSSEFFGRGEQIFFSNDFSIGIDLFKGETAFKPVVWALRLLSFREPQLHHGKGK